LYVVEDGWLKAVKVSVTRREQVVRIVGPGEALGGIGVLAGGLNQATAQALEPTSVWIVRRDPLLRLMEEHLPLARAITQNLARRVMHLMSLVEDLSLRPVIARLARLLVEQSSGDVLIRRSWSTQAEIAAQLGTVPEVLNRALRFLTEEGLIQVERRQITIVDREGLEKKALSSVWAQANLEHCQGTFNAQVIRQMRQPERSSFWDTETMMRTERKPEAQVDTAFDRNHWAGYGLCVFTRGPT
jgi:CRP-like cAMP-binding protein